MPIAAGGPAELSIDLRPDVSLADLAARLAKPRGKQSLSTFLRKAASLSPVAIGLLHETCCTRAGGDMTPMALAALIKAVPVRLTGAAPIATRHLDGRWRRLGRGRRAFDAAQPPGVFVAGEMLDWEAPTGGYLLQACFATGALAARGALAWLARAQKC